MYRSPESNVQCFNNTINTILPRLLYVNSIICGDFNHNTIWSDINDLFTQFGYNYNINKPTRIAILSKNIIDNIYTKCIYKIKKMKYMLVI